MHTSTTCPTLRGRFRCIQNAPNRKRSLGDAAICESLSSSRTAFKYHSLQIYRSHELPRMSQLPQHLPCMSSRANGVLSPVYWHRLGCRAGGHVNMQGTLRPNCDSAITEDKSQGVLESALRALPRGRSAAGAGVWSLAVLDLARLVTWS